MWTAARRSQPPRRRSQIRRRLLVHHHSSQPPTNRLRRLPTPPGHHHPAVAHGFAPTVGRNNGPALPTFPALVTRPKCLCLSPHARLSPHQCSRCASSPLLLTISVPIARLFVSACFSSLRHSLVARMWVALCNPRLVNGAD